MAATGVQRGCGTRVQGGVYAECPLSETGQPIEAFLLDPPRVLDLRALGISPIGVRVMQLRPGTPYWIFDWVGSEHYPNVADFVEETKRHGLSRRIPKTADFTKLTPASRIILFHQRAMIDNFVELYEALGPDGQPCPKLEVDHRWGWSGEKNNTPTPPSEMCARLWWEDVTQAGLLHPEEARDRGFPERGVVRSMPMFNYYGRGRPPGFSPSYTIAAFLQLPITNLAVIRANDGSHEQTFEKVAGTAGVPVVLEDE